MGVVNPRVDIAFKKIFGVEENKDLLMSLINAVVGSDDQVADITLMNPYNPKNFPDGKLSILDIKARGQDGKRFNIEIQISDEADYDKRALYYWAKLYTEQLKAGDDYGSLSKAIGIHILNFTSILGVKAYHNVFHIREKTSGALYFEDLELHTIELKKFCEEGVADFGEIVAKVKNSLDMWVAFLTRHDLLKPDRLLGKLDSPDLKKALGVLEVMNFDATEREIYEGHLKWLRIEANTLRKYEGKGFERGLAEGEQRGIEKVALKLLTEGMTVELIAKATGLSVAQIETLLPESS
jgi:predicted transposase/invertase (TIGR01784 family)